MPWKRKRSAAILAMALAVLRGAGEAGARELPVVLHFQDVYGIPAVPVRVRLSRQVARVNVGTRECRIAVAAGAIRAGSVRVECDGKVLPARALAGAEIEFVAPVRPNADLPVRVFYEPGKSAPRPQAPRPLPRSWTFTNRYYELRFDARGRPLIASRMGKKSLPLAAGSVVMDVDGKPRPVFDSLESIRLLSRDALGAVVEVVQRRSKPALRLVSTYRCYFQTPFFIVEKRLTNRGKDSFTTPGWYYDRLRVTPGGRFDRKQDQYTELGSTGPYARTHQWPWGSWKCRYTDASEPGKAGIGLYADDWDALTHSDSVLPGGRGRVCMGGWSPNPRTGLLYMVLNRVKLPPGRTLRYRLIYLIHHGDPNVTRRFAAARRLRFSAFPAMTVTGAVKAGSGGPLEVSVDPAAGVVGVRSASAEWCFAIDAPALEWLRVRAPGPHYRWDGVAMGGWTGFLLRISRTPLPLGEGAGAYTITPRTIPRPNAKAYRRVESPYTIQWPTGSVTVSADGRMRFHGFPKTGELSTLDFSRYEAGGRRVRECLADDMPEPAGSRLVAWDPGTGVALAGDLQVRSELTDDGLTPSLERKVAVGSELQIYSPAAGEPPEWFARRWNKPAPAPLPAVRLGPVQVRLTALPPATVRLWPARRSGCNGRPIQLGVNPLPVRLDLELVNSGPPERLRFRVDPKETFVQGIATDPLAPPKPNAAARIPGKRRVRVSLWATLREDTFGRYRLALQCSAGNAAATLRVPIGVRLRPVFGTWVYYRNWWERPDFGVRRSSWPRYPEDLLRHRIDAVVYQKTFREYRSKGHLDFKKFDREIRQFLDERIRLVISADHWGSYQDWLFRKQSPVASNPKYVKFLRDCYGELMPRYDHYPNVIAWYNFDEIQDPAVVNLGYDLSVATGITRPVHSLFMLAHGQAKAMAKAGVKTDIWHCDPYTTKLKTIEDWTRWSRNRFPKRIIWVTLSGHAGDPAKWRRVRQQGIAAYALGCDGVFYWMYQERAKTGYWVVQPGPLGPITTPRWESIRQAGIDLEFLANIDYLLARYGLQLKKTVAETAKTRRARAVAAAESGKFYACRRELLRAWEELARACGVAGRAIRPDAGDASGLVPAHLRL